MHKKTTLSAIMNTKHGQSWTQSHWVVILKISRALPCKKKMFYHITRPKNEQKGFSVDKHLSFIKIVLVHFFSFPNLNHNNKIDIAPNDILNIDNITVESQLLDFWKCQTLVIYTKELNTTHLYYNICK